MFTKTDIKIPSSTPGWNLDTWQYLPFSPSGPSPEIPPPVIVMAHGFSANKLLGLDHFAEAFANAGYACLVFDYRTSGASDGTPRNNVDVKGQHEDYRSVIRYVREKRDRFDHLRIIVWGFSLAGGHSIVLGSDASLGISAIISLCPFTSMPPMKFNLGFVKTGLYSFFDSIKRSLGLQRLYIPATAPPGRTGVIVSPGALEDFESIVKDNGDWPNQVAASVALDLLSYTPRSHAGKITCPILVVIADGDNICPPDGARAVAEMSPKSETLMIEGGHFDAFPGKSRFEEALKKQIVFLQENIPTRK